jgi:leader peptidase (prepilin peptidase)/N-methyltransferase
MGATKLGRPSGTTGAKLLLALVCVSIVWRYGVSLEALEMLCVACVLFAISLADIDSFTIPNRYVAIAFAVRVVYIVATGMLGLLPAGEDAAGVLLGSAASALGVAAALLAAAVVMDRVLGRESLGGGDVKLLAVAAFYFGWEQSLFLILVACVAGIVCGLAGLGAAGDESSLTAASQDMEADAGPAQKAGDDPKRARRPFPWGPSIAFACWLTMLVGEQVLGWYLGLLVA